jgi:hypothetical protein
MATGIENSATNKDYMNVTNQQCYNGNIKTNYYALIFRSGAKAVFPSHHSIQL